MKNDRDRLCFVLSTVAVEIAYFYAIFTNNVFGALLSFSLVALNLGQYSEYKYKRRKK